MTKRSQYRNHGALPDADGSYTVGVGIDVIMVDTIIADVIVSLDRTPILTILLSKGVSSMSFTPALLCVIPNTAKVYVPISRLMVTGNVVLCIRFKVGSP